MFGVKKLDSFAIRTGFVKSDLANFSSFLPLLSTTLLSSTRVAGRALVGLGLIFNIEVSRVAILLKP